MIHPTLLNCRFEKYERSRDIAARGMCTSNVQI